MEFIINIFHHFLQNKIISCYLLGTTPINLLKIIAEHEKKEKKDTKLEKHDKKCFKRGSLDLNNAIMSLSRCLLLKLWATFPCVNFDKDLQKKVVECENVTISTPFGYEISSRIGDRQWKIIFSWEIETHNRSQSEVNII